MKRFLSTMLSTSAFLGLLALPAAAAGTLYDCKVKQTSGARGWISERVAVVIDAQGGGKIIDSITLQFETGPKSATVRRTGDTLKLRWSHSGLTDRSSQIIPTFSYTATLDTKTGAFKMRAKPARFPQTMRGAGTCQARGNLSPKQLNRILKQG